MKYVGTVVVNKIIDPKLFLLCTLEEKLSGFFEYEKLNPAAVKTSQVQLKQF